jgi:hypothetical protein
MNIRKQLYPTIINIKPDITKDYIIETYGITQLRNTTELYLKATNKNTGVETFSIGVNISTDPKGTIQSALLATAFYKCMSDIYDAMLSDGNIKPISYNKLTEFTKINLSIYLLGC